MHSCAVRAWVPRRTDRRDEINVDVGAGSLGRGACLVCPGWFLKKERKTARGKAKWRLRGAVWKCGSSAGRRLAGVPRVAPRPPPPTASSGAGGAPREPKWFAPRRTLGIYLDGRNDSLSIVRIPRLRHSAGRNTRDRCSQLRRTVTTLRISKAASNDSGAERRWA